MKFLNHIQKNIFYISAAIAFLVSLNSCGIWDPADARKVSPNAQERVKKNLEEGRGITLGGALVVEVKPIISSPVLILCGEPR